MLFIILIFQIQHRKETCYFQQISNKPFKKRNAAIKENNFILYNTKALDIIRMWISPKMIPL